MQAPAESLLTVDLDALAANFAVLRAEAGGAEAAPVVKADGYGLGAAAVARRLRAEGARRFFVARLAEGEALRAALRDGETIHVLDGAPEGAVERLIAARLSPVLSSVEQARRWRAGGGDPAVLHVDTGMNRLGVSLEEVEILAGEGLAIEMVLSHLACAGDPGHPLNTQQLRRFEAAAQSFPFALRSLANTSGLFLGQDFSFDVVRPGIGLYGGGPLGRPDPRLKAVATLQAPILQVRTVAPGETVGYGAAFTATETTRVAVIAAGYADGIVRAAGGRGFAWLDGRRCPLLGRISMDLIAVDVGELVAAKPGAMVELLGPNAPLDLLAEAADTIAYELLVRLGGRGRRIYLGDA